MTYPILSRRWVSAARTDGRRKRRCSVCGTRIWEGAILERDPLSCGHKWSLLLCDGCLCAAASVGVDSEATKEVGGWS
jgi:hypothetical protein